MTDTKELLQKIAALRMRLNTSAEPSASTGAADPLAAIEDKLQRGAAHNTLIESSLHAAGSSEPAPTMPATCPGRRAPTIAPVTARLCRTQATATSAGVQL